MNDSSEEPGPSDTSKERRGSSAIVQQQTREDLLVKEILCAVYKAPSIAVRGSGIHINAKHLVVMVGLPARGKSYMAKKLTRYLNWIGINTKVFNAGDYRRTVTEDYDDHNFFKADNPTGASIRAQCAINALKDLCSWLSAEGAVGIFDATNSTKERRKTIVNYTLPMGFKTFFVESICDDSKIIEKTILEIKANNPDYKSRSKEEVLKDFMQRIQHYMEVYESIDEEDEEDLAFLKIYNAGIKCVINKHEGHIQARIIYFLINLRILPRTIYLTRSGLCEYCELNRYGGDSQLAPEGRRYAKALGNFLDDEDLPDLKVWTSWMKRSKQTASFISAPQERWALLDEIKVGAFEGLTSEDAERFYHEEVKQLEENPFQQRFPNGESCEDVVGRLEPVIMELERQGNVIVVTHKVIVKCLLAYFLDKPVKELPKIEVPLHTIIKLSPVAYGCHIEHIPLLHDK